MARPTARAETSPRCCGNRTIRQINPATSPNPIIYPNTDVELPLLLFSCVTGHRSRVLCPLPKVSKPTPVQSYLSLFCNSRLREIGEKPGEKGRRDERGTLLLWAFGGCKIWRTQGRACLSYLSSFVACRGLLLGPVLVQYQVYFTPQGHLQASLETTSLWPLQGLLCLPWC